MTVYTKYLTPSKLITVQGTLALLGALVLVVMRFDSGIISDWKSIGDALSVGNYMFGYPLGPFLALTGFLTAAIASLIYSMKHSIVTVTNQNSETADKAVGKGSA